MKISLAWKLLSVYRSKNRKVLCIYEYINKTLNTLVDMFIEKRGVLTESLDIYLVHIYNLFNGY